MKKKIVALVMACLLLTGCKSVSIESASQNLENAKNYKANISLEINGKFDGKLIDFERNKSITIDNINSSAVVDAIEKQNNKKTEEKFYLKLYKDIITTYKKYEKYYQFQTEAKDKNSLYYISAFINKNSSSQYIETKKGIVHYVVTLNKDRVKDFLNSYYDVEFLSDADFDVMDSAKINVYVNSKTKMIESLDVDFSSILKFADSDNFEIDRFYLEINYLDFNSSGEVKVPEAYIEKAIDKKIIDSYNDANSYLNLVNSLALGEEVTTYTNTNLEYLGISPSKVSLTVLKGKVISGSITINNYEFKVESGIVSSPDTAEKVE